ncbi:hypothetical protein CBS101457_006630 [Exobasidium rhododendri]|nr:hypothetical protein CBS101457_006630 [Exobasidium rhododendri]
MDYNFTGLLSQRRINLGSAHEISSAELAQQAREERALRLEIRQRHAAATVIQSTFRGRKSNQQERQVLRQRLQDTNSVDFYKSTKIVGLATQRHAIAKRLKLAGPSARLSSSEQRAFTEDDVYLKEWAVRALQSSEQDSIPNLLAQLQSPNTTTFTVSLLAILRTILLHFQYQGPTAQAGFQPFIDVLALLITEKGPAGKMKTTTREPFPMKSLASSWCYWLDNHGLYTSLRSLLMSVSLSVKHQSKALTTVVQLILEPLRLYATSEIDGDHLRPHFVSTITEEILTIPCLPSRISRSALTQFVLELPLIEVADRITKMNINAQGDLRSVNLLANVLAIGWKRVPHLTSGLDVKTYLLALTAMQDGVPFGILQSMEDGHGSAPNRMLMIDAVDEDGVPPPSPSHSSKARTVLDATTLTRLQILPSQDHISSLLTASAKYPNSTREALCAFLASTLQSWDAVTRDQILACITYRHSSTARTLPNVKINGGVATHSIEGLVRELWRGWIRGSPLAKSLSTEVLQGRRALISILDDERFKRAWPCLVVLCQLYSRALLTIGDDEFYPTEVAFGSTASSAPSASRNPLSLDEIVALSGLLRNLAFSLYWYEGTGGVLNDLSKNSVVGIKTMDLMSLRDVLTRLLQQLHHRDSRRSFAPKDHWLMNNHLDLKSFIESVVLEEDELNQYQEGAEESNTMMEVDEDSIGDDEANQRTTISSRIASRRGGNLRGGGLSARSLAYLSPRLGVLNNIPFVIPFEVRVEIFHQFTALDYQRLQRQKNFRGPLREVSIRRTSVAEDGFVQLNGLGENLKHKFAIKFIDQFGIEESGIDGGGLFKEFLTSLVREAFDTDRGLWSVTPQQQLYPNPHSYAKTDENLQWYKFLGRILGKALYHGILVDVNFASFFLSKWLGKGNSYLDDLSGLESLDKDVYRNLLWLKHYSGDIEKDLTLDFTVTDDEFGEKRIHELVPNGRNIVVTKENRLEYIYRVSHYRLNEQIRLQSDAFLSGLTDIIDLRWLRILDREELRTLISGSEGAIDLADLQTNTVLGGYHEKDEIIEMFWKCLESFTHAQRKAFLKFVTSCPSPPLLGFAQLIPKFGIRHGGDDTTRLPTSSTCVNLLKLPRYTSYDQLREKLLYAIESGAGFDLS